MKKILLVSLVFILTACGAAPVQQEQPTPIIVTVIVPVIPPTEVSAPTAVPTEVPTEVPPTPIPPTAEVVVVTATTNAVVVSGGSIPIENALGKGVFSNITMSNNSLTLRCSPREITFNVTANLPEITDAFLSYRIVDSPDGLYPSAWQNNIPMKGDGNGNFTLVFSGESVNPDLRLDKAWLDVQFIGTNKGGGVVDRTQKIERLITYGIDCP